MWIGWTRIELKDWRSIWVIRLLYYESSEGEEHALEELANIVSDHTVSDLCGNCKQKCGTVGDRQMLSQFSQKWKKMVTLNYGRASLIFIFGKILEWVIKRNGFWKLRKEEIIFKMGFVIWVGIVLDDFLGYLFFFNGNSLIRNILSITGLRAGYTNRRTGLRNS